MPQEFRLIFSKSDSHQDVSWNKQRRCECVNSGVHIKRGFFCFSDSYLIEFRLFKSFCVCPMWYSAPSEVLYAFNLSRITDRLQLSDMRFKKNPYEFWCWFVLISTNYRLCDVLKFFKMRIPWVSKTWPIRRFKPVCYYDRFCVALILTSR